MDIGHSVNFNEHYLLKTFLWLNEMLLLLPLKEKVGGDKIWYGR